MSLSACLAVSCSSNKPIEYKTTERKAFKYQILIARSDYKGQQVSQFQKEDKTWDVKPYNLGDENFRKDADEVGFWCILAGKHWYFDQERPGLARRTLKCNKWEWKWFKKSCKMENWKVLYLDGIKDFHTIVAAGAMCRVLYRK